MDTIFPWQLKIWQQLSNYKRQQRIPSGLLLSGPSGIGKQVFAHAYSKHILCHQESLCSGCRSCTLFDAGNHPDFFFIQTEEKSQLIKIEQIRELMESLSQTPQVSRFQVAVIFLAEEMNKAAANALLKTLEEPRGNVLLLLVSHQPNAVPATIRSRCQHIKMPSPILAEGISWLSQQLNSNGLAKKYLAIADNLPIKAMEYANNTKDEVRDSLINYLQQIHNDVIDPIHAAAECLTLPLERLQFLMTLSLDMIRIKFNAHGFLNNADKAVSLEKLANSLSVTQLYKFLDNILDAIKLLANRTNVNVQLLMEKIFINWRYNNEVS